MLQYIQNEIILKLDKIEKFLRSIDEHKGGKSMFDVFFDFLIGIIDNAKISLKNLNRIQRIIAMILYCIEMISLLVIALLTIDEYRITSKILYFFGLFIFVSICHILLNIKYLNNSDIKD